MENIRIGQRWISEMEPELGLGMVIGADRRTVRILFRAGGCERQYALASAPIQRVRYKPGDSIRTRDGSVLSVEKTADRDGILIYTGNGREISEQDLCDTLSFTTPEERLSSGLVGGIAAFDLRLNTLLFRSSWQKSPAFGFQGGRIDLINHQIHVAHEASSRPAQRILLSDETGLGKTIEACLILHRLLLSERISRVLLLVPESLVHQWFVELLRKFNLVFRLVDEDYCNSIENTASDANAFLQDALCLCDIHFLADKEKRSHQAVAAGWDLVIVDEAHHLTVGSRAFRMVQELGSRTRGLIFLTATPEQSGPENHFSLLHLLDPERYPDFKSFQQEERHYSSVARLAGILMEGLALDAESRRSLAALNLTAGIFPGASPGRSERIQMPFPLQIGDSPPQAAGSFNLAAGPLPQTSLERERIAKELLDQYGTGRAVFRNTRTAMKDWPQRQVHLHPLQGEAELLQRLNQEFLADELSFSENIPYDYSGDPRISWLAGLLKALKGEKALLLCRSIDKVRAIDPALRKRIKVHPALFHEGLSLLQRDRNAAWFAAKEGASLLLCSEIGCEGRNFQFVHHLVLWDLPLDPELLEQRIGRLDRIGQKGVIHIHVPYVQGSSQETVVRWHHEGLNDLAAYLPGAHELHDKWGAHVRSLAEGNGHLQKDLDEIRADRESTVIKMKKGKDRLLELHSFHPGRSMDLIRMIRKADEDPEFESYCRSLLGHFGVRMEKTAGRNYALFFDLLVHPDFPVPVMRDENLTATFERGKALYREDIEFLTLDHPMITGAMDLILGSETGNSAAAIWPDAESEEILLEAIFILECVAPPRLQIGRFLPPAPIQCMVNDLLEDKGPALSSKILSGSLRNLPLSVLMKNIPSRETLGKMISRCREIAASAVPEIITKGLRDLEAEYQSEMKRSEKRKSLHPAAGCRDIGFLREERDFLEKAIRSARLRLDALMLVFKCRSGRSLE
ncbi:RNA polymerase-associated protein RapA [bacterium]|nr:RNA polymerase-associated protein RapA [bacterium]